MKDYLDILTIKKERHAIIQLNRPEKMNALSHNLRAELFDALKDFEMDPEVKVIIIRGSDADSDGANNWQEWRADTIPTNSVSALRLVSATNSPSGAVVTWQSVATRNYWLERATNLGVASPFQTIATNIVGTAGTKTFTDTTATNGGPYLYRVGVQ